MKKRLKQSGFLIFLFILFFMILNMIIFPLININTIKSSFILIFSFWAIMILLLFFVSRVYMKDDGEENV